MNFAMPHHTLTTRRKRPTTLAREMGLEDRPWAMLDVAHRLDADHPIAAWTRRRGVDTAHRA